MGTNREQLTKATAQREELGRKLELSKARRDAIKSEKANATLEGREADVVRLRKESAQLFETIDEAEAALEALAPRIVKLEEGAKAEGRKKAEAQFAEADAQEREAMKGVERAIGRLGQAVSVWQEAQAQGNGARNALGIGPAHDVRHVVLGMLVTEGGILHDADLTVPRDVAVRFDPRAQEAERKQKAAQAAFDRDHEEKRRKSLPFVTHEVKLLVGQVERYREAERQGVTVTDPDTGRGVPPSVLIPRVKASINDLLSRLKPEDRQTFESNREGELWVR